VQLFCAGHVSDALELWRAKTASWDANISIDIQLLCGAGRGPTKQYLVDLETDEAAAALSRLTACEEAGDFDQFSVDRYIADAKEYYTSGLTRSVRQEPASGGDCGHSVVLAQVHFCSLPQMQ